MKMRRRTKKISVKSKSLRYSRKKIIRKKMARLSVSLSSNSPRPSTSSQPRLRNGVIRTGLPKLSILGKETQCNFRLIVDEDNDDGSIRSRPSAPFSSAANSVSATSVTQSNTRSSYLSEIEAGQASLFHFSTRHMQVNSDHSMSPIPVAKHSSSTIKTNQMNAINTNDNPVSLNNSSLTKHSTDNLSLVPKPPTFLNSRTNVLVSSSNNKCQSVSVSTAPIPSTSRTYPNETGSSNGSWSLEAINRVKSILKHHLKAYVSSHRIDKETCRDIFQRSWAKIIRKPAHKLSAESKNSATPSSGCLFNKQILYLKVMFRSHA
ncbi:unnamed protein product [Heterobilharzia americana]|nr:unnamed protein product [Heterobilharzia americana]